MIDAATTRCLQTGVTTIRLTGELTPRTSPAVRRVITKAAAECPTAVIADLSRLSHDRAARLDLFPTLTYEAQNTWGVPVLLYGADADLTRAFAPFRDFVALYPDHTRARMAVRAYVPRWVRQRFAPVVASAAEARALIGEACLAWGLIHLKDPAQLVASELAANAITHAGTAFDLLAAYTGRYLRVAVRDGSRKPVIAGDGPGSGRGLRIVTAAATHWGTVEADEGKIVWVIMRAHRW